MPRILDAVEARCTLGAITDRMKAVFGVHRDPFTF
jgi:methylmalonyl-CoA mutase N-terminal domain/subunit